MVGVVGQVEDVIVERPSGRPRAGRGSWHRCWLCCWRRESSQGTRDEVNNFDGHGGYTGRFRSSCMRNSDELVQQSEREKKKRRKKRTVWMNAGGSSWWARENKGRVAAAP